ncbi:hypothetical protein [Cupriavidus pampae]|uniref:Uncharacterized protein n=1 Tax=Cupriavidus pampae TaxID=659251 RepID=A0ABM8XV68_9BURK|nr:hypothetical protein [Cupriavidus pampae]CAG9184287.1 hypothetical protein LMG32289_05577 [Cupriavidus pampae]
MMKATGTLSRVVAALVIAATISGCQSPLMGETKASLSGAESDIAAAGAASKANQIRDNSVVHRARGAWLGGKPMPVSQEASLPEIFRQQYEFRDLTNKKINLAAFARIFANSTGIPVRVGDVYGNTRSAMTSTPTAGAAATNQPPVPLSPTGAPIPIALNSPLAGPSQLQTTSPTDPIYSSIDLNYTRSTPEKVLNDAMTQWNLNYEWQDGAVVISKYITRKFTVKMPSRDLTIASEIGKSSDSKAATGTAAGGGGATGGAIQTGFNSSSTIRSTAELKAFTQLVNELQTHLRDSLVTSNNFEGTVTVTGNRDAIMTAQRMIDRTNEIVSRSAKFNIAIYQIKTQRNDDRGVDLNVLFSNLSRFGLALTSPASLVSSDAGGVTFNVLKSTDGTVGKWDGTQGILKSLYQDSDVVTLRNLDVLARNRRATPVNLTNQTSYLAQTTPATASQGGTGGVPGLTPGVVTTGFAATVEANINDSNQINLDLSLGIVDLVTIDKFGTGSGASAQMIQLPVTAGFEFQQSVDLRPGEMLVLTGYETRVDQYIQNKLAKDLSIWAGGSFTGKGTKDKIVIVVTPTSVTNSI